MESKAQISWQSNQVVKPPFFSYFFFLQFRDIRLGAGARIAHLILHQTNYAYMCICMYDPSQPCSMPWSWYVGFAACEIHVCWHLLVCSSLCFYWYRTQFFLINCSIRNIFGQVHQNIDLFFNRFCSSPYAVVVLKNRAAKVSKLTTLMSITFREQVSRFLRCRKTDSNIGWRIWRNPQNLRIFRWNDLFTGNLAFSRINSPVKAPGAHRWIERELRARTGSGKVHTRRTV